MPRPVGISADHGRHPMARVKSGVTRKVWDQVMDRDHAACQIAYRGLCEDVATQVDHVVPKSKGGTDHPDNLRAACKTCNQLAYIAWLTEAGQIGAAMVMAVKFAAERMAFEDPVEELSESVRRIVNAPKGARQASVRGEAARIARRSDIPQRAAFLALVGAGVAAGVPESRVCIDVRVSYRAAPEHQPDPKAAEWKT